jgi:hypothetical protein
MAESLIRCRCPHCGGRLGLKDPQFLGKMMQCPKCHNSFVVKSSEDEVEEVRPQPPSKSASARKDQRAAPARSRKPAEEVEPVQASREDDDDDRPRKKKERRDHDEDDEEDRPRKKKKKKQKSSALLWVGIGGGVVVLAVTAVLLIWLLNRSPNQPGGGGGGIGDQAIDVSGAWPDPGPFRGVSPPADAVVTFHIVIVGVSLKNGGQEAVLNAEADIHQKLGNVVRSSGSAMGRVGASDDDPSGRNRRMTDLYGPVPDDPKGIADRITFGTVRSVSGRTITVVVPPAGRR